MNGPRSQLSAAEGILFAIGFSLPAWALIGAALWALLP